MSGTMVGHLLHAPMPPTRHLHFYNIMKYEHKRIELLMNRPKTSYLAYFSLPIFLFFGNSFS